jgi:hypothetical protein
MFRFRITKLLFNLLAIGCLFISQYAFSQSGQIETARVLGDPNGLSGYDCETTMAFLDFVAIADRESGNEFQAIIIIARLGKGESSRTLIHRRLRQAADYLARRVSKDKIVTAEGDRARGLG